MSAVFAAILRAKRQEMLVTAISLKTLYKLTMAWTVFLNQTDSVYI